MTIEEGLRFFGPLPKLARKLQTLYDVGLGYVKLGQPSTQLSGGEAQRVKLATELSRRDTGRTLYILDEPTTGLHVDDVKRLLEILQRLCENGSTVLVIEHNLDVIKCATTLSTRPGRGDGAARSTPAARRRRLPAWKELHRPVFENGIEVEGARGLPPDPA